jgi:hemin uptake protein HemP
MMQLIVSRNSQDSEQSMTTQPNEEQLDPRTPSMPEGMHKEVIESATLLGGRRELTILHGEHVYRLRLTTSNKLILTK